MVARVDIPSPSNAILPEAGPYNEIEEASRDDAVLATLCARVLSIAYWTIGRAVRPSQGLPAAFSRIGDGDYAARIAERGPFELTRICRGFNQMGRRPGEMEARNWYLTERLAIVEERSDPARDLHDEIGPLLFASDVDLASTCKHKELRSHPVIAPGIYAIRDAVGQTQKGVGSILGQLRPTLLDRGPERAVDDSSARRIVAA
jgi:two-component system, NarL family, sensor histidine kinase UhpB